MLTNRSDEEFVRRAVQSFAHGLATVVDRYRTTGRDPEAELGPPEQLAERLLAAGAPGPSPWDEIAGPFLRTAGVQARLGITRQAVSAKAFRRRLLRVVTADGQVLYPAWQFDGDHVVAGLPEVLSLFSEEAVDGWTLAGWLRTVEPELDAVPLALLREGQADVVLVAARRAAAALAA
jgi:hypothetical protein